MKQDDAPMISGAVHLTDASVPTGEPRITVHVADLAGEFHPFDFLVDTGFDGDITLPLAAIQRFGLPYLRAGRARLADDLGRDFRVYGAEVLWQGITREVVVLHSETQPPLLGMALLWGSRIAIEVQEGGEVTIEAISEI